MDGSVKLSAFVGLLVLAFTFVAVGCSDHGPTNLYSSQLTGKNQSGANIQIRKVQEFSLSNTPGVGPDQYVIVIQNIGPGGLIGPITAQVSVQPACGATLESDAAVPVTTSSQTVIFGAAGPAIYSGDRLVGNASDMTGQYQYSVQTQFPAACSTTTDTFNMTMTDSKGDKWTGSFTGTND